MDPRAAYPLHDESRIDEFLDDNRVLGVCSPPRPSSTSTHISASAPFEIPANTSIPSSPSTSTISTDVSDLSDDTVSDSNLYSSVASSLDLTDNSNVQYDPLVQPALIKHEIVPSLQSRQTIARARYEAARVIAGADDRVLVVVGPCSIHSPELALEYARRLKDRMSDWPNLLIVMRSYL